MSSRVYYGYTCRVTHTGIQYTYTGTRVLVPVHVYSEYSSIANWNTHVDIAFESSMLRVPVWMWHAVAIISILQYACIFILIINTGVN